MTRITYSLILAIAMHCASYAQTTYYSRATANTWSLSLGGSACSCSPTAADFVVISHNWANTSFYPLTHPANLAYGNFLSVNPKKVTVKSGGVAYQQPNLATGSQVYVESGGFWGYNGSLTLSTVAANSVTIMQNAGTILVNGSYNNSIAINSATGVFCKNGAWVNTVPGSLNGITAANMDSYFTQTAYGCTNCCTGAGSLPVDLASFELAKKGNDVVASWTTVSEINNDYFELQTSEDGINWITVSTIDGAGNSNNINDYSYADSDIQGYEIKYYRLKQVDFDGTITYSYTKWVQVAIADGDYEVYQNENEIIVMLNYKNGTTQTSLYDMNGQQITQGIAYSNNSVSFSKGNLAEGVYMVQVISQNQVLSKKVFVHN